MVVLGRQPPPTPRGWVHRSPAGEIFWGYSGSLRIFQVQELKVRVAFLAQIARSSRSHPSASPLLPPPFLLSRAVWMRDASKRGFGGGLCCPSPSTASTPLSSSTTGMSTSVRRAIPGAYCPQFNGFLAVFNRLIERSAAFRVGWIIRGQVYIFIFMSFRVTRPELQSRDYQTRRLQTHYFIF